MLRLPLQLAEGEQHFSEVGKTRLWLSVGFEKEAELVPLGTWSLLDQELHVLQLGTHGRCLYWCQHYHFISLFSHQITTCKSWPANMTASESSPRARAASHPSKTSFPSTTITCSLPITEVRPIFLLLTAPSACCWALFRCDLFRGTSGYFPHEMETTTKSTAMLFDRADSQL